MSFLKRARVPFRDFRRALAWDQQGWEKSLRATIETADFMRPSAQIRAFEDEFAEYCGVKHAIATSSGSTALLLSYLAFGLNRLSDIVTVSNTFAATVEAAELLGATSRFVDIERNSYAMDPTQLRAEVSPETKLIVPLHPFGRLADVEAIASVASELRIPMLEEACHAHGAERNGMRAGAFGAAAVFSFGASKPLGGLGEGGAVTTNDDGLAQELRYWNDHGRGDGDHIHLGLSFRMHPMEASFLRARLRVLDGLLEERRRIAGEYNAAFLPLSIAPNPCVPNPTEHSYYVYVVEVPERGELIRRLNEAEIEWAIHYPIPIHRQAVRAERYSSVRLPRTEEIQSRMVSLPLIPGLTEPEISRVIEVVSAHAHAQHGVR